MRINRTSDEQGVALITALLATLLATGLMAGMFAALTADQKSHSVDRDQSQAYAAAHAGLEKLTSGLAQLFVTDFSPSAAQIDVVDGTPPSITGFTYTSPGGSAGSGYQISFNDANADGSPDSNANADITTGPFVGFKGLITPYTLTVTARSSAGSEVRLRREVQTVAVPVFQFGIFGEKSLSFHAGANFDFGGRVHTNTHLFLAQGGGTLTFRDKITAVGEVVRSQLENTTPITTSGHEGNVSVPQVIGTSWRNLGPGEGSVVHGPGSAFVSGWKNLSEVTYNTNIRNYKTGAKRLDLPLVSQGATPIDLIRRPALGSNENNVNSPVFLQRYYAQASLRILISDRATDLTGLPGITPGAPIELTGPGLAAVGYVPGAQRTPVAGATGAGATVTVAGSTYAAPYWQVRVTDNAAGIPGQMKLPATGISINGGPGTICTGKTANAFTGCTIAAPAPVVGQSVTAILASGVTVQTQVVGPVPAVGANRTLNVTPNGTLRFTNNLTWINEGATPTLKPMTCEGYSDVSPRTLTNCRIFGGTAAAVANGRTISTFSLAPAPFAGVPVSLLGGFIKIEKQNAAGAWSDVTMDILNLGFAAPNQEGTICEDPTPNAVIRLQRLRDNGGDCNGFTTANPSLDPRDYWPNALYDAREGSYRDIATTSPAAMGGLMNYVGIDVGNLARWFSGAIGTQGATALNNNGYIVYFSDRRGNHNDALAGAPETGEYGHEDSINQAAGGASSPSNAFLEGGEDRNENNSLETYGATPSPIALYGAAAPFNGASNPLTPINNHPEARVNRQVFFRRALKLTNGGINGGVNSLPATGLTIAAENGTYVQGNYNATSTDVNANPNRPAAILADVLTILSTAWSDAASLRSPNNRAGRDAATTGYRFALVAGKSVAFTKPGWAAAGDFGTDGGVHNFMRMLEDWGGQTINYRGSIVSLYTARQLIGIYRVHDNTYNPGTRAFAFDTNFLTPALLPPGTPMFRDINTLKFRQILRPNQ
jgi:hypothetical protein